MKRVFFVVGALLACTLAVCCVLSQKALFVIIITLFAIFLILLAVSVKFKFLRIVSCAFLFCITIIIAFLCYYKYKVEPITNLSGKSVTVYGQVVDFPKEYTDYTQYKILVKKTNKKDINKEFKINCYTTVNKKIKIYDNVKVDIELYNLEGNKKFTNFSKGVFIGAETLDLKYVSSGKSPNIVMSAVVSLHNKIKASINKFIEKEPVRYN